MEENKIASKTSTGTAVRKTRQTTNKPRETKAKSTLPKPPNKSTNNSPSKSLAKTPTKPASKSAPKTAIKTPAKKNISTTKGRAQATQKRTDRAISEAVAIKPPEVPLRQTSQSPKTQSNKKKKVSFVFSIILCIICLPIFVFNCFVTVKVITARGELPVIFGTTPLLVQGFELPPEVNKNDLIFLKVAQDNIEQGSIICYFSNGVININRVLDVTISESEVAYVVKSATNPNKVVLQSEVEGVLVGKIAGFGSLIMFMQSTWGIILFGVLPLAICFGYGPIKNWIKKRRHLV